jgi:predicted O-methyltransferase YrrM
MNLLNKEFITSAQNFYGTENMAMFLYSHILFTRPTNIIEVGAGYSSMFIAQAIEDVKKNVTNLQYPELIPRKWLTSDRKKFMEEYNPKFTIVETEFNNKKNAIKFNQLNNYQNINKVPYDIYEYLEINTYEKYDMVYMDFGDGSNYLKCFYIFWNSLQEGGYIFVHNTLTNYMSRLFISEIKLLQQYEKNMEIISFLEPHKKYQNSFTIIKKNKDYEIYNIGA